MYDMMYFAGIKEFSTHNAAVFTEEFTRKKWLFDLPSLKARIKNGKKYNFDISQELIGLDALEQSIEGEKP